MNIAEIIPQDDYRLRSRETDAFEWPNPRAYRSIEYVKYPVKISSPLLKPHPTASLTLGLKGLDRELSKAPETFTTVPGSTARGASSQYSGCQP